MLDALCGVNGDKQADDSVREALAEAVLCLARAEASRRALWAAKAPGLLGKGYEDEDNPIVCQCMEGAAELFLQDGFEPAAGEGAADGAAAGEGGGRRDVQIQEID